jgi:hypothetical protein
MGYEPPNLSRHSCAVFVSFLGVIFDHVGFDERKRFYLAVLLVVGSVIFPLGVILQTVDRGVLPQAIAAIGAGFVILALAGVALGFARRRPNADR